MKNLITKLLNNKTCFNKKLGGSQRYAGFTLAEVLITICILGLVAEMTIPGLAADIRKQAFNVKFKKVYSELNQALRAAVTENGGSLIGLCTNPYGSKAGASCFRDKVAVSYKNPEYCDGENCKIFTDANGAARGYHFPTSISTSDGAMLAFEWWTANCSSDWNGSLHDCATIHMDVNGKDGPNRMCSDIFILHILKDGRAVPWGVSIDYNQISAGWGADNQCPMDQFLNY